MSTFIPYGRQSIDDADIAAVEAVLRSDWLTQGPAIAAFEEELARRASARHAVAVCNATAALHIACVAAGLGPGDRLWTVPNTFVASANCGRYCGADVDFVDIDPLTWCMDAAALEVKLEAARRAGTLPKVVIPVAFAGGSCDMKRVKRLSDEYGFTVIEDASHAVGASYAGRPVGCGDYAHMTVFSFHPVKIVTTGEGGAVLTNDPALCDRLRRLRSHGITRDRAQMDEPDVGAWSYEMQELGFNYRITDIQAVLGLSQLKRLDGFLARRRMLVQRYDTLLKNLPLQLPQLDALDESAWHLYVVRVKDNSAHADRRAVFDALRAADIGVNVHYIPVHLQPYYRRLGFKPGDFPQAEQYYREALSLPLYAALTDAQQDRVVAQLKRVLG
ncbi:DegT/DnrJ/EryC1/StrS aminotransferase [Paraburkholderia hospita]|jgi:UDP-4-amino-4,6-dideoxy-N-acetyl-beta-L-altrosamine transaminase|uniref:DegT/DnrJ/EryC1/StrS aminotransferase n=1 Tax=Paraburkholderia hospita TaxID=169430 RepID=A0ABN0FN21_9BURK|nr:UDP-4-amino-4,6-dideoxy-N-acetyl-beta-L-altrosamine transaminase [Paraburkholderia hospita]EIN00165.1 DegT/DnrJ/EryC1/StrS aminotransferase [Paraburkholderia hospita]OUL71424.1 UDP-4-amino-4,6-dideoxy-N-acetyl-beta-L-altrosamine transaminase [Paraburkholderia hospita]SKC65136.1 UDP-4-amino-4,6-dideoxy-N-acetyl-beta-L-altrosamine transaminase [Burkholderia sp. CF099]